MLVNVNFASILYVCVYFIVIFEINWLFYVLRNKLYLTFFQQRLIIRETCIRQM